MTAVEAGTGLPKDFRPSPFKAYLSLRGDSDSIQNHTRLERELTVYVTLRWHHQIERLERERECVNLNFFFLKFTNQDF